MTKNNIIFLQVNLDRTKGHDLMEIFCNEKDIDVVIISEPNVNITSKEGYLMDNLKNAAICISNKNIPVNKVIRGDGYVGVQIDDLFVTSVYISPNVTDQEAEGVIDSISEDFRNINWHGHLIVAGDLNAKAVEWGSSRTDRRGVLINDWLAAEDLVIVNEGSTPTFVRQNQESVIDVTFCSARTLQNLFRWKVHENEETCSCHRYISCV